MKDTHLKDYDEIIKVGQSYLDSCKLGDSSIMENSFHKNATINGEPIKALFDRVNKAGKSEVEGRIDVVDVIENIAVIRVTMENYFGENFVDLHLLMKDENGWKIVTKVFVDYPNE